MICARYERVLDFIKMHYCLTQRTDTQFWRDNTDATSIPETLRERLAAWRHRPPHRLDFVTDLEMFMPSSWQYVLYGMEFRTDLQAMRSSYPRMEEARREFAAIQQVSARAMNDLPKHRELVEQMCRAYQQRSGEVPVAG
jgi:tryptophan halogenase